MASWYGTLRICAALVTDAGELAFKYDADSTIGVLYNLASAREK